ncbi:hypothetical protein Patl1_11867 [Pistacia atlantica]|uniref:Uncharacterized protein n=1 Tax=Pistacia atlantica TaxID=434234 RepID=A0ACC1A896_9ROSI|nr:hypothetical protein Patl1_11867 [Pistacia atlantica]
MASAQVQLPHNLDAILQEADSQINKSSDNLIEQLHGGIFLNQNKLASPIYLIDCFCIIFNFTKFSVEKLSGANTFEIYARGLTIAWGNDERYKSDVSKKFPAQNLTPRHNYEVSCSQNLTPRHNYEVSFVLMKLKGCEGFQNHPVNLKLTLPNQPPMEHKQDLSILPENKWSDVPVGMFSINCCMTGDMEISMYEHGSQWKKGIVVDKIIIRPLVQPQN